MFFGGFATHLVYLGELTQIRYSAARNRSMHYTQFVRNYLHDASNKSEELRNRTKNIMAAFQRLKRFESVESLRSVDSLRSVESVKSVKSLQSEKDFGQKKVTKVLLISSNPRSGSSFTGK